MATELWKSLGGAFQKRWLTDFFVPALAFWGGWLCLWAQLYGVDEAATLWQGYNVEVQILMGAVGLLLVFITGLVVEVASRPILRVCEGYWPPILKRRAVQRAADLKEIHHRQNILRTKLATNQITPTERSERARIDALLVNRPADPEDSMPTELGDILRTAERYAHAQYGLDPITFWPRLYPHLSDSLSEALAATRAQLDLALRLALLAILYGLIGSIVVVAYTRWDLLLWTLPTLFAAWLFRALANPTAISYAGLLRSAFDLHRFDVYEAMRWPIPTSLDDEKARGTQLCLFLKQETRPEGIVYQSQGQEGDQE